MSVGLIVLASLMGGISALAAMFLGLSMPVIVMIYITAGLTTAIGVVIAALVMERLSRNAAGATQPDGPLSTSAQTVPAGPCRSGSPQSDIVHLAG